MNYQMNRGESEGMETNKRHAFWVRPNRIAPTSGGPLGGDFADGRTQKAPAGRDWADTCADVHWMDGGHGSGLSGSGGLGDSRPMNPRNIRPEIRAGDGTCRQPLDSGTPLSRNLPLAAHPLADGGLPQAEGFGHRGLAAEDLYRVLDCIHEPQYRHCR